MKLLRRQDDVALPPGERPLDAAALAGRWINTNAASTGIAELVIDVSAEGAVLKPVSRRDGGWCAWGVAPVGAFHGSDVKANSAIAFSAAMAVGPSEILLRGNVNLGVLVIASFNRRGKIGPRPGDYFSREFYRLADPAAAASGTPWRPGDEPVGANGGVSSPAPAMPYDRSELLGDWRNTNRNSSGIERIRIADDGDGLRLDVTGVGRAEPIEWGSIAASPIAYDPASTLAKAFSARFEADGVAVNFSAYMNLGLLVVASFTSFNDGSGRAGYFHREFYHHD